MMDHAPDFLTNLALRLLRAWHAATLDPQALKEGDRVCDVCFGARVQATCSTRSSPQGQPVRRNHLTPCCRCRGRGIMSARPET